MPTEVWSAKPLKPLSSDKRPSGGMLSSSRSRKNSLSWTISARIPIVMMLVVVFVLFAEWLRLLPNWMRF
jgi:hypothetical protein